MSQCNKYQIALYNQLMKLKGQGRKLPFFYKDFAYNDDEGNPTETYRIFGYRMIPNYTTWNQPGALGSRGITYEIRDDKPLRLVCHPMEKFFNLNENPLTQNIDLSNVGFIEDKADGSLISTYLTFNGTLRLKTRGSLYTEQALESTKWLEKAEHHEFRKEIQKMVSLDTTVNMEWVSPSNRIVVKYTKPELRVLNIRSNTNGSYWDYEDLPEWAKEIRSRWTQRIEVPEDQDLVSFLESTPTMNEVEGFVIQMKDTGMRIKLKTNWYFSLHQVLGSIHSTTSLFKAVIDEVADDLKSKLFEDPAAVQRITKMEDLVGNAYQDLVSEVEGYHAQNKELSQRDYAIAGKEFFQINHDPVGSAKFGLAMKLYHGDPPPYKKILMDYFKDKLVEEFDSMDPK